MRTCQQCAGENTDSADTCRYCGHDLKAGGGTRPAISSSQYGFEYRSATQIGGWPLIHIATGIDPDTGRPRIARGVIAIGNVAIGLVALGGVAFGGLTFGGASAGLLAIGGIAVGGISLGGMAIAAYLALGGLAISAKFAIGGLALAPHAIGGNGVDPEFLEKLQKLLPRFTSRS